MDSPTRRTSSPKSSRTGPESNRRVCSKLLRPRQATNKKATKPLRPWQPRPHRPSPRKRSKLRGNGLIRSLFALDSPRNPTAICIWVMPRPCRSTLRLRECLRVDAVTCDWTIPILARCVRPKRTKRYFVCVCASVRNWTLRSTHLAVPVIEQAVLSYISCVIYFLFFLHISLTINCRRTMNMSIRFWRMCVGFSPEIFPLRTLLWRPARMLDLGMGPFERHRIPLICCTIVPLPSSNLVMPTWNPSRRRKCANIAEVSPSQERNHHTAIVP